MPKLLISRESQQHKYTYGHSLTTFQVGSINERPNLFHPDVQLHNYSSQYYRFRDDKSQRICRVTLAHHHLFHFPFQHFQFSFLTLSTGESQVTARQPAATGCGSPSCKGSLPSVERPFCSSYGSRQQKTSLLYLVSVLFNFLCLCDGKTASCSLELY